MTSPAFLLQLAGALKPSGSTKVTSTSNVASTITAGIYNAVGDGALLGGTSGAPATAAPSYSDATSPYATPSYLGGGLPDSSLGTGNGAFDAAQEGGIFNDPVILIGGVVIVGALAWAFMGK